MPFCGCIVCAFHTKESNRFFRSSTRRHYERQFFTIESLCLVPYHAGQWNSQSDDRVECIYIIMQTKKLHTSACLSCVRWTIPHCTGAPVYNEAQSTRWECVIAIFSPTREAFGSVPYIKIHEQPRSTLRWSWEIKAYTCARIEEWHKRN